MTKTVVLTFSPLPTTSSILSALLATSFAADSVVQELAPTSEEHLEESLSEDGMVVCAGSLAKVSHLLAPNQKAFFAATEDSFLFRSLISSSYPEFKTYKTIEPWTMELDWTGGRTYVVKPNIGYASSDTFVVGDAAALAALASPLSASPPRDFVIEEYLGGLFLCADVVVDGGAVLVTSVYRRYDYGIKETAQYHSSGLYSEHVERFSSFVRDVAIPCLPLPPNERVLFNIEAKLGEDGVLRIVEINPFRACGVAPLLASLVVGENVFEAVFEKVLGGGERMKGESDREFVAAFARDEGETAEDLVRPIIEELVRGDGEERRAVEVSKFMQEEDGVTFGIHDGRIFELVKEK